MLREPANARFRQGEPRCCLEPSYKTRSESLMSSFPDDFPRTSFDLHGRASGRLLGHWMRWHVPDEDHGFPEACASAPCKGAKTSMDAAHILFCHEDAALQIEGCGTLKHGSVQLAGTG